MAVAPWYARRERPGDLPMASQGKIVVIDDTAEILDFLDVVLSDDGFQVVACARPPTRSKRWRQSDRRWSSPT